MDGELNRKERQYIYIYIHISKNKVNTSSSQEANSLSCIRAIITIIIIDRIELLLFRPLLDDIFSHHHLLLHYSHSGF